MKKFLFLLLACGVAVPFVSGCGGSGENEAQVVTDEDERIQAEYLEGMKSMGDDKEYNN